MTSLTFTDEEQAYATTVVAVVGQIVPGLAASFSPRTEVLLHNLTKFPNSIEVIAGDLTGRTPGGPPTDLGLKTLQSGVDGDLIGYRTQFGDGSTFRSSSLFFRAPSGRVVVALCINSDISDLLRLQGIVAGLTATPADEALGRSEEHETFPTSVDELARGILLEAISTSGLDVSLMKKSHKLAVVRELDDRGFFAIRESVELAARSLEVSRYTIYNYLNELQGGGESSA